jgi:hypothetical protein
MGAERGAYNYFDMSRKDKGYQDFISRRTQIPMPPTFQEMRLKQLDKEWELHCYNQLVRQSRHIRSPARV